MANKVYVNNKYEATIVCEKCGKWRQKNVSPFMHTKRPLKIKCSCNYVFDIFLELRSFYRKKIHASGIYKKIGNEKETEIITIEDISQDGIKFRTIYKHNIKIGDMLRIRFVLDNEKHAEICKHVRVKYIQDCLIGTQFCTSDSYAYKKEIGAYLMTT